MMSTIVSNSTETIEEVDEFNVDEIANRLSNDYQSFLHVDASPEVRTSDWKSTVADNVYVQKKVLVEAIEDSLAHLEEFCSAVDLIRNDNTKCFEELMPVIYEETKNLDHFYANIDKLEHVVSIVKHTVLAMEEEVERAESLLSSSKSVKKFFSSLFSNNSKKVYTSRRPKFSPPKIYDSNSMFLSDNSDDNEIADHNDLQVV